MSDPKDENPGKAQDLDAEIQKAMSEAAAAVAAVREEDAEDAEIEVEDAADAGPDLSAELEVSKAKNAELRDKWLRAVADHENFRKRTKRDIDDAVQQATSKLLESFLPTVDNLERAVSVATDADEKLVEGIRMVTREFVAALSRHGITPVESVGRPFDPTVHDALQQMDSPDHAPGVIIQEFEKGYLKGERLLRPARVVVAGPGSTGQPDPAGEDEAAGDQE